MYLKNYLAAMLLLFATNTIALGQPGRRASIALSYDDVSVGRNINFTWHKPLNRSWTAYGGLKYHINSKYYRNDYALKTFLYKELYAANLAEHLGFKAGIEKTIGKPNHFFELFAYYDFQFTHATAMTINKSWMVIGEFPDIGSERRYFWQYAIFENTAGLGIRVKLVNGISFRLQGGIGMNHIEITQTDIPGRDNVKPSASFIWSRQFALGLQYTLKTPTQDKKRQKTTRSNTLPQGSMLSLAYDDIQSGRNLNIGYRQALSGNIALYAAFKLHINTRFYQDYTITEPYYFKQFRPEGLREKLGITAGIEKCFPISGANIMPFAFYELQVMRGTVSNLVDLGLFKSGDSRSLDNSPFFAQTIEDKYFEPYFRKYGPVLALENYLGAGARMGLSPKINLKIKAGIGYNIYIGPDKTQNYYTRGGGAQIPPKFNEGITWTAPRSELSRMFSLGLEYKLGKK
jgi:hypothetical protein